MLLKSVLVNRDYSAVRAADYAWCRIIITPIPGIVNCGTCCVIFFKDTTDKRDSSVMYK